LNRSGSLWPALSLTDLCGHGQRGRCLLFCLGSVRDLLCEGLGLGMVEALAVFECLGFVCVLEELASKLHEVLLGFLGGCVDWRRRVGRLRAIGRDEVPLLAVHPGAQHSMRGECQAVPP
jgi:hypothetical protein